MFWWQSDRDILLGTNPRGVNIESGWAWKAMGAEEIEGKTQRKTGRIPRSLYITWQSESSRKASKRKAKRMPLLNIQCHAEYCRCL